MQSSRVSKQVFRWRITDPDNWGSGFVYMCIYHIKLTLNGALCFLQNDFSFVMLIELSFLCYVNWIIFSFDIWCLLWTSLNHFCTEKHWLQWITTFSSFTFKILDRDKHLDVMLIKNKLDYIILFQFFWNKQIVCLHIKLQLTTTETLQTYV